MVSIVIVTHNSKGVLPDCLSSIAVAEGSRSFEIIVVDNNSTDDTLSWLEHYTEAQTAFSRLEIVRLQENRGFSYANNRGFEASSGDVVLFLNPDTIVGPESITRCSDCISSHVRIGAIGCRLLLRTGELDKACRRSLPTLWNSFCRFVGLATLFPNWRFTSEYNLTYLPEKKSYEVGVVSGAFLMTTRNVFQAVMGFDERYFMYGEDVDLCYKIRSLGYKIWYNGRESVIHIKGANGGKRTAKSLLTFYTSMALYYRIHHDSGFSNVLNPLILGAAYIMFLIHFCVSRCFVGMGNRKGVRKNRATSA